MLLRYATVTLTVLHLTTVSLQAQETGAAPTMGGIGAMLRTDGNRTVVRGLIENAPAEQAGLKEGDIILAVDGADLTAKSLGEVVKLILGPEGTRVVLRVESAPGKVREVPITRGRFAVPKAATGGARIDFILASAELAKQCKTAQVANRRELDMLSDHYPVVAEFELPAQNGAPNPLRIVTYNVLEGFRDEPERAEKVAAWLREENPDVVALQELNGFTPAKLSQYAAQWGHSHAVLLKRDGYSTGLTSRAPIQAVRRIRPGFWHGLLCGETCGIRFYVVHYAPGGERHEIRDRESRLTREDIAAQEQTGKPVILLGDFNSISPHDYPQYDGPNIVPVKRFLDAGFVDLAFEHRKQAAFTPSIPTPLRGK